MNLMKLFLCFAVFAIVCVPVQSSAQLLPFIDDFEDGSATDGMPGTWVGAPGGTREVVNGDFITSHTTEMGTFVEESLSSLVEIDDVSIRTRLRILEGDASNVVAGVTARDDGIGNYLGAIFNDGTIGIARLVIADGSLENAMFESTDIDPRATDVFLQLDLFGDDISLTAWADGSPKPTSPQLTIQDDTHAFGVFGVFMNPNLSPSASVAYRYYEAVPEPSLGVLLMAALMSLTFVRRH